MYMPLFHAIFMPICDFYDSCFLQRMTVAKIQVKLQGERSKLTAFGCIRRWPIETHFISRKSISSGRQNRMKSKPSASTSSFSCSPLISILFLLTTVRYMYFPSPDGQLQSMSGAILRDVSNTNFDLIFSVYWAWIYSVVNFVRQKPMVIANVTGRISITFYGLLWRYFRYLLRVRASRWLYL